MYIFFLENADIAVVGIVKESQCCGISWHHVFVGKNANLIYVQKKVLNPQVGVKLTSKGRSFPIRALDTRSFCSIVVEHCTGFLICSKMESLLKKYLFICKNWFIFAGFHIHWRKIALLQFTRYGAHSFYIRKRWIPYTGWKCHFTGLHNWKCKFIFILFVDRERLAHCNSFTKQIFL